MESFVTFLYANLQWTTGDFSDGTVGLGGIEALAGFNAGDQINSYTIPGTHTSCILNITITSDVKIPGKWASYLNDEQFLLLCKHLLNSRLKVIIKLFNNEFIILFCVCIHY